MTSSKCTKPVGARAGQCDAPVISPLEGPPGCVMSWMLERRLSFLFSEFRRMKYFCAWLATCAQPARLVLGAYRKSISMRSLPPHSAFAHTRRHRQAHAAAVQGVQSATSCRDAQLLVLGVRVRDQGP